MSTTPSATQSIDTLTNISPRQANLRQVVGAALLVGGGAAGIALAVSDASMGARVLSLIPVLWGGSWIFGGRSGTCPVDAMREVEHPTELISFGVGGMPVVDERRATAIKQAANRASLKGLALSALVAIPILVL